MLQWRWWQSWACTVQSGQNYKVSHNILQEMTEVAKHLKTHMKLWYEPERARVPKHFIETQVTKTKSQWFWILDQSLSCSQTLQFQSQSQIWLSSPWILEAFLGSPLADSYFVIHPNLNGSFMIWSASYMKCHMLDALSYCVKPYICSGDMWV